MTVLLPICALFLMCYYYITRTFNHWKKRNVKGPKPIPLFGNIAQSALRMKHVGIIYKEIYDQFPDEDLVGIFKMTTPSLLIRDLDIVKQILVKDFECFSERGINFSADKLGNNLFHSDTDTWRALRSHLTPAFTSGKLRSVFPSLEELSNKFVNYVESLKENDHDALRLTLRYTVATIMAGCFGLNIDTFADDNTLFEVMDKGAFGPSYWNEIDMVFPGMLTKFNLSIFPEMLKQFSHEIIKISSSCGNKSESCNIVDILMRLKEESNFKRSNHEEPPFVVTEDVIASQLFVFFIAGYGNNTIALSYALYYLAQCPEIQDKLIAEIDEVTLRFHGKVTYDCLKEMKYLNMVFYETLRMHPLTNSVARAATQDYKIENTEVVINKGTTIVISPYAIQHDEKHYPNPEVFDPERFAGDNIKRRHPCAFIAFGAGPRGCLGLRFAKIQFGLCLVKLLTKFRVESSRKTRNIKEYSPWRTLLTPRDGVYINFIPRNKPT